ncbi:MAG TPA: proton-conducting transporter membrane subunit [Stellaceae bacterium]|jgi:multicomponent Na+:H+ antiporter subunit D|nr:proton-conducting transporter membrane subunit [Stellaceae bacterium]
MPNAAIVSAGTTPGGFLLVLAIMLPVGGLLLSFLLGGRHAERVAIVVMPFGVAVAAAIAAGVWRSRNVLQYVVGGWHPPLGVALRADGLSAAMIVTAALLVPGIGLFARAQFATPPGAEARAPLVFWTLLLAVWAALNAVFLGADLFNLFVALELLTFAAVPLVCLDGRAETLAAALRYLLFALLGSVLYLLGTVLLYGAYGTLDIALLSSRVRAEPLAWVALSLMTAGLLAKAALYPLHLWLPPAHAGAPAPASALLSGLVVKAPFFLVVRLWFDVMPGLADRAAAQLLGALAAAAILFGSVLALRQARLKLLIAYSTVAQIGYLFLMFPLSGKSQVGHPWGNSAWTGGVLQAVSHAFAKAAMFMAAGLVYEALGHDRIAGLAGIGRALPITIFAFGLGGLSLMGLPPSGGFVAKAMLLTAAVAEGQWWWALVVLVGGLLAGGYVFLVLARALADPSEPLTLLTPIARTRQMLVLALALFAVLLGFVPLRPSELLMIGRPHPVVLGFK